MKKHVEILPGDYAEWDWETVEVAGADVMKTVADIAYHNTNPGEGWDPFTAFTDPGDVPKLIAEVRGHIERLEGVIKKARKDIADVERNARLAALRRQRKQAREAEENG